VTVVDRSSTCKEANTAGRQSFPLEGWFLRWLAFCAV
jgi:hypothetical protein